MDLPNLKMDLPNLKMDSSKAEESHIIHVNPLSFQLDSIKKTTKESWKAFQGKNLFFLINNI